ncbi:acyl-CoA transferase/carnitine dehydratase [Amycolatopsis mediterranei S699]|uniref:Acyl-CoA transferase/carnitine dehydratase n=2 Tax=Amycolatopsis mediterranei TaxID=33910 RepID=A0A0H3DF64_AMYMU|nr:acyl-CoA transferase/carnitine dehydratase [Amycolatopsis mediterranei U32]AEK45800.1 acyl-CoA transferase/carnitine dehydratase [Amycolatopsis mediterranei S699]AFO80560.1 acyl-CoA transferase/carnitine dehydratase [Amycolatopsis mediterranei S699]AGT87688.1 acyl-CoA transferase/carnitine dehydratase [Amycolatopsis mediterranei RB]UZF73889.1 CoA transferase [Amycolatopsis mediterranei]
MYRYCRGLDRIDLPLADSVGHPDGIADYGPSYRSSGAGFLDFVWAYHAGLDADSHLVSNVLVDVDVRAGTASSGSYVAVWCRTLPADGVATELFHRGRYVDRWYCRDGRWAIVHRVFVGDLYHQLPHPAPELALPWGGAIGRIRPTTDKDPIMSDGPLAGLRVLDAATLAAGPLIATWLGEHGGDVIKVEQPGGGDALRQWGAQKDGVGLLWKSVGRNKKSVTLNLREERGRELLRRLAAQADVVVLNLRPSTLHKWGLDYETLAEANPGLVMVHVTGYGAGGPKSDRPGFGTLGEAMSGFAHLTGSPDGPPTLPSFMLADGVAALTATYAVMMALYHRDVHGAAGQLIDVNLIEPLARLLEQPVLTYDQFGTIPVRTGNRWDISAPRNVYRTKDGHWLAMSGSAPTIARRALEAVGRPELTKDPRFAEAQQRLRNAAEIDGIMAAWIAERTLDDAMTVFEEANVAAAPVYDAEQLLADPQLQAREVYPSIPDADLGSMRVQAPVPRFSATPGRIDHLGPALGEHNNEVYGGLLGLDAGTLRELREQGVI